MWSHSCLESVSPSLLLPRNIFGAAEPTFGGQWKFGRTRGAVLVLHRLQITSLPGELLAELKEAGWGKGKQLVTQSYACPGYALYLSNKSKYICEW